MTSHTLKKNFDKLKEKKETALITYTVAGDPDKETSLEILKSIAKSGANIIEIGLPHNTPIGDGKEIQNSAYRAISNGIKVKIAGNPNNTDNWCYAAFAEFPVVSSNSIPCLAR